MLSLIDQPSRNPLVCFYVNVGYFYQRLIDDQFRQAFQEATHIYLNSFYLGWLLKRTTGRQFEKLNAEDFVDDILLEVQQKKWKLFLLGSTSKGSKQAVKNLQIKYPTLQVWAHHGYPKNEHMLISQIKQLSPDIMLVGLGFDNQEKWVATNLPLIKNNVKLIITIGNFIDILGQKRSLPPLWFKHHRLEWLWRLAKEPRRLWKRYLLGGLLATVAFCYTLVAKNR